MKTKQATILCVDDEEPGLRLRKLLLESEGHRVLTALSGYEGIRLFKSDRVDAVILDYWMAGMNGLAVARELKRLSPKTPIIMLSAFTSLPDEALGAADLWLLKGEDPENLLAKVRHLLENRSSK